MTNFTFVKEIETDETLDSLLKLSELCSVAEITYKAEVEMLGCYYPATFNEPAEYPEVNFENQELEVTVYCEALNQVYNLKLNDSKVTDYIYKTYITQWDEIETEAFATLTEEG